MSGIGPGNWLFDLGNTRLKAAPLLGEGRIGDTIAFGHAGEADAIAAMALPKGEVACVASVAGTGVTTALLDRLARQFGRISIARTQSHCDGLRIAYVEPARLGVDRFLALLAARGRGVDPALVVGVGTALTIDLVDADGLHRGGRIAASPALMRAALHVRARQLPEHGGQYREFADDSDDALASGCEGAAIALVQRSFDHASALLDATPRLLVHGGGAEFLLRHLPAAESAPGLVLEGLARWAGNEA